MSGCPASCLKMGCCIGSKIDGDDLESLFSLLFVFFPFFFFRCFKYLVHT